MKSRAGWSRPKTERPRPCSSTGCFLTYQQGLSLDCQQVMPLDYQQGGLSLDQRALHRGGRGGLQGYLAHKKQPPPPQGFYKALGILLL